MLPYQAVGVCEGFAALPSLTGSRVWPSQKKVEQNQTFSVYAGIQTDDWI